MDVGKFLSEFRHIVSSKNGINQIRQLIYNLAITGQLTRQMDDDDDIKSLLLNIKNKKEQLIAEKKIKRLPKLQNSPLRIPKNIKIPNSWYWSRLVDIGEINPKNSDLEDDTVASFLPMSSLSELHSGTLGPEERPWGRIKKGYTHFADGDIVIAKITPCFENGKAAVISGLANGVGAGTTELHVVRPLPNLIEANYIYIFLRSPYFTADGKNKMTGTAGQKRLPLEYFATRAFPVPPIAEQKRIVAKVDELMALCDKLEAQYKERLALGKITRFTALNSLSNAVSISDIRVSWHRLQNNMYLLVHEAEDIEDFKSTILELAISGKLNARESSVSDGTLENMRNRKRNLAKNKLIKRETPIIDFPGVQDLLVDIPETWIWCRLDDIASVVRGGSPRPAGDPRFYGGEIPFLKVADITKSKEMFVESFTSTIKEEGLSKTREITERTVLLTNSGATLGVPIICTFRATFNDGIAAFIELAEEVFDEYLYFYLKAKSKWLLDIASRGQGQPNLNTNIIRAIWFPLPPIAEQRSIVDIVKRILALCNQLTEKQELAQKTGALLASAAVASITGIQIEDKEKMKVPKTELVSTLRVGVSPANSERAPLVAILIRNNGEMPAKTLWQASGLEIDAFYQRLKTEMARGWIVQPEVAYVQEMEAS